MEVNQPASEVSSHGCSPHDEQVIIQSQKQQQASARSYECNFCKKGFSNAQALGGHMNIHRKDKAKLKQASSRSSSSSINSNSCYYKPLEITSSGAKWHPCIFSSSDGAHNASELKQLPLFVEKASTTTTTSRSRADFSNPLIIHASSAPNSSSWHEDLNFQSSSSHGSFGGAAELDLELRLGHVPPPKSTSVSMGTRKFF